MREGGDKWYSLHSKFIFSEKDALITSSNLDENTELEIFLKYKDEDTVKNFDEKFKWLYKNFIEKEENNLPGNLINKIEGKQKENIINRFNSLGRLLIKNYPSSLTPDKTNIERGLILTPFDIKARNLVNDLINESESFLYFMSERIYDESFVNEIIKKAVQSDIDIKLITGKPEKVRQNTRKAREFFRKLGSAGVEIGTIEDVHSKLWMNEKRLAVGSTNIGKMNLGFKKSNQWRSNTESLMLETNREIITAVKSRYREIFVETKGLVEVLGESNKAQRTAKQYFGLFDHYSRKDAKKTFGRIRLKFNLEKEGELTQIAKYSAMLAKKYNKRYIEKEDIIMSTILTVLKRRSSTMREIRKHLNDVIESKEIGTAIDRLMEYELIEKTGDEYEVKIDTLIS